ncbi:hypothetical protein QTP86_026960 [Hemibagrus guttatus]|nr:hypothetical protein QTP86_026960 [Hemibagrus guttatus]
MRQTDS